MDTTVSGPPSNQRLVFLEALGLTMRERYPEVGARISQFKAGLPPMLRLAWHDATEDVGCDLSNEGWAFVWGFDPRNVIGPAGDLVSASFAVANVLGIRRHPDR
ncbi:hypothetical protein BTM25_34520 [Actinomadura rubteroloni]|uniref:Uncharacterized protein n=1 Tax=Actinomadura rubteroloni TaxID=1926885 RepID=A0A2P4UID3_9ACTN|nr:hypothetical protein [Actinomadura rubteroloni]POM24814.1 hypothetical protein BTM25_34520 [Actinomadura rubteroloni]